ncbi:MAG: hypothetical protein A3G34_14495 [Candidatus Lindowbacteria bacterium RIFCSPLOWO2_12_FULL_62_27]|nr:MAG: hypothetical protein A3I06_15910 [Candidatus Lindowbacteria bacterium RIFCSPLOWO2_02_FULL_62_12]OGH63073.1 MAG: hypothetical protein A3G34_14495 [Candidatus Lindowbacteria bacterium RIFCSPLOWO2_12_FULL_62_27]
MAGETGMLYTSLNKDTAKDEVLRHAAADMIQDPLVCAEIQIRMNRVLDLTRRATLNKLGISRSDLTTFDLVLPQAIGLQARRAGFEGMIVPSATGEGHNLVIFEDNLGEGCRIEIGEIQKV